MTSGTVALQGGAEFAAGCRELDLAVVATAPIGPVVVLAGAAAPGAEHDRAVDNGVRYYRRLVDDDVRGVPDPREDLEGAVEVLEQAALVVLPGGSPQRLLEVLLDTAVGEVLRARWTAGATISGSSAGAMVLTERTWLPERDEVVDGLGLVPGIVVPHHAGGADVRRFPGDARLWRWGLPECAGVLVDDATVRAVGQPGAVLARDGDLEVVSTSAVVRQSLFA